VGDILVAGTAAVLLLHSRGGMQHYYHFYACQSAANSTANPAANAAADTPTNTATDGAASDAAAPACRPGGPLQLRSGHTEQLESRQKLLVLQGAPRGLPSAYRTSNANADASDAGSTHDASSPCRPIQLRRRLRQLGGRLECAKEGLVLQGAWKGLPRAGSRLRSCRHH